MISFFSAQAFKQAHRILLSSLGEKSIQEPVFSVVAINLFCEAQFEHNTCEVQMKQVSVHNDVNQTIHALQPNEFAILQPNSVLLGETKVDPIILNTFESITLSIVVPNFHLP